MSRAVPVIAGPTGVGKTALGILLAQRAGAEIISADSRQVFRHLDIGTAKPDALQRRQVPHHLIDFLDPGQRYSAAAFARDARGILDGSAARNIPCIIVGGSGLYLRALVEGLARMPPADQTVRMELEAVRTDRGTAALHDMLADVDPEAARRLKPNDALRVIRALEVHRLTGLTISQWHRHPRERGRHSFAIVALTRDRERLCRMIDQRVDAMVDAGLEEEVRRVLDRGYSQDLPALRTVGYSEMIGYIRNDISKDQAIAKIKQNTRRYAKRQMTWFRGMKDVTWINLDEFGSLKDAANHIATLGSL